MEATNNVRQLAEATAYNSERIRTALRSNLSSQPVKNLGEGQGAVNGLDQSIENIKSTHSKMRHNIEIEAIEATAQLEVELTPEEMAEGKANLDTAVTAVENASAEELKTIAKWFKATDSSLKGLQESVGTFPQFLLFFNLELGSGKDEFIVGPGDFIGQLPNEFGPTESIEFIPQAG